MTDIFIHTKLDLIKKSLTKLETAVTELREQLYKVEDQIQQEEYAKLEEELNPGRVGA